MVVKHKGRIWLDWMLLLLRLGKEMWSMLLWLGSERLY
jgi:hypothetical protein